MNLIYIHGLDSDANSTKGMLLEKYCQLHHPDINVLRPDLNKTPAQVCEQLLSLIKSFNNSEDRKSADKQTELSNTVLIGSS
ncbi:YqiA/YcfP family alpha/beta fold hydrolase, partial [Pseudomonas sp. SIMBA_041]|uniref:YqiA/YcfP family alpha/beta fold hydrolase n=1 Tax=Pseudomonas sp. SIMBA_041 TaxID=3085782 RepID=UPI0039799BE5